MRWSNESIMKHKRQKNSFFLLAIFTLSVFFYFCFQLALMIVSEQSTILTHYLTLWGKTILWLPLITLPYFLKDSLVELVKRKLESIIFFLDNFHWSLVVCFITLTITSLIALFAYNAIPKTSDEVSLLFQAKIFASGHWAAPLPPLTEMFQLETTIVYNHRWFSMYQPGHSLMLAAGCLFGLPWLVGPLLSTGSIFFTYRIAQSFYDETNARLSTILLISSPFFLLSGSTYTVHNTSLFALSFFTWMVIKYYKNNNPLLLLCAGIGLGLAFITRAYTALAYCLPIIAYGIYLSLKKELTSYVWFWIGLGFLPFFLFQLWNNFYLTGDALIFPYQLFLVKDYNSIGFGKMVGGILYGSQGHTFAKAFINFFYNLSVLSFHTFGWPLVSLLPFLIILFRKLSKTDAFVVSIIFSQIIAYFFYWYNGVGFWGPRFYTEILPLLVILSIQGIRLVRLKGIPFFNYPVYPAWIMVFILILGAVLLYIPLEINFIKNSLWGCKPIPALNTKPALVLVRNLPQDVPFAKTINMFIFPAAFNKNDPQLQGDVIYGKYLPNTPIEKIRVLFPFRSLYRLRYVNNTNTLEEITP